MGGGAQQRAQPSIADNKNVNLSNLVTGIQLYQLLTKAPRQSKYRNIPCNLDHTRELFSGNERYHERHHRYEATVYGSTIVSHAYYLLPYSTVKIVSAVHSPTLLLRSPLTVYGILLTHTPSADRPHSEHPSNQFKVHCLCRASLPTSMFCITTFDHETI